MIYDLYFTKNLETAHKSKHKRNLHYYDLSELQIETTH